jgi:hypothetical protein
MEWVTIFKNLPINARSRGKCFAKPQASHNALKLIGLVATCAPFGKTRVWPITTRLVEFGHRFLPDDGGLKPPRRKVGGHRIKG